MCFPRGNLAHKGLPPFQTCLIITDKRPGEKIPLAPKNPPHLTNPASIPQFSTTHTPSVTPKNPQFFRDFQGWSQRTKTNHLSLIPQLPQFVYEIRALIRNNHLRNASVDPQILYELWALLRIRIMSVNSHRLYTKYGIYHLKTAIQIPKE